MDAIVEAALKKWPNVPHCYGWLALDARGDWYMRDERIQRAGQVILIKSIVAGAIGLGVDQSALAEKFAPGVVAVTGQEGVVEIE